MIGIAHIGLGRFDEAVIAARKSIGKHPSFLPAHLCLASALAHLGQKAEADITVCRILELQPDFRLSPRRRHWPSLYAEGLEKAGLPE